MHACLAVRSVKHMKTRFKGEKSDELRREYPLRELLKKGVQGK